MLVRRFYDPNLAQASYLIGAVETGAAMIVDANRDIDQYLRVAAEEGVAITHVTETHIHADFLSGSRELALATGATLLLSHEGGAEWQYAFAASAGAVLLRDGSSFDVGGVHVDVMHTPGHTPEHLIFLVTDSHHASAPLAALTGDFVFVGDVGRPDLLERAAQHVGTMDAAARMLFRSLQRLESLPDFLQLWPGHGAGSACGKALGAVPQTTLGYERRFNWAFRTTNEDAFVANVLAGQPDPPRYFAEMKRLNKIGPPLRADTPAPQHLPAVRLGGILQSGGLVVDTRPAAQYAAGHAPGTINIPFNKAFTTWAGWLVPYTREFYVIVDGDESSLAHARRDLAMIGLDRISGFFRWAEVAATLPGGVETTPQITAEELSRQVASGGVQVLDVRSVAEWHEGHLAAAQHIPLGDLPHRIAEVPDGVPVVVHCLGGTRSAIAASVLQAAGKRQVINFPGGYSAWRAAGFPTETAGALPHPA